MPRFWFVSHSDNRSGIISGFISHFLIIFDIVLTLCVGIAMTTVALWSIEGYAVSVLATLCSKMYALYHKVRLSSVFYKAEYHS